MTTIDTIPLARLIPSKANVRRIGVKEGVGQLAASIHAHGLRQNLNVRAVEGSDRFEVVAGGRRYRALKLLVKQKRLSKDAPIPCRVLTEGEDAAELSLVENTVRAAMHPLDEFEAFERLVTGSRMPFEDVAARFGVTPLYVERRLRLARVSPKLRDLYREASLTLEQLMAFAVADDHEAQEQVWEHISEQWDASPRAIRAALTQEHVAPTHKLARFVGIEAYAEAGGAIIRDLFEENHAGYLVDRPLLMRLVAEKLAAAAERFRAEGWGWVRTSVDADYSVRYGSLMPLPNEDEADETERYSPEDMARAGVMLSVRYDGDLDVTPGCLSPEEDGQEDKTATAQLASQAKAKSDPNVLPPSLVADLTAHRTAALRAELARDADAALAVATHALALSLLYPAYVGVGSCLEIRASSEPLDRHVRSDGDCRGHGAMSEHADRWRRALPEDAALLLDWCLTAGAAQLRELFAYCVALSVNAVQTKHDRSETDRLVHADALAETLALDMAKQWTPSVEGFYARLSKAQMVAAVSEAKVPMQVSVGSLRKDEAARYAAKAMQGTGWLPAPLRTTPVPEPAISA